MFFASAKMLLNARARCAAVVLCTAACMVSSHALADEEEVRRIDDELVSAWRLGGGSAGAAMPMEDLSFPIDHFEDGSVRAQFNADWALVPDDEDDFVRAKGIRIDLYDEEGNVIGCYVAENCIFDRATRTGYCEGPVRIEYKAPGRNIKLEGMGMQWNLATRNAKILSEPILVMSQIMGELGGAFR